MAYTLRASSIAYVGTIKVTFRNRTSSAVSFVNCGGSTGVLLEKLVDGAWRPAWSPLMLTCLSPPITVAPGAEFQTAINVWSAYPGTNYLPLFAIADIPGTYRAVWTEVVKNYHTNGQSFGDLLPLEHRISNEFTLAVQPRP